MARKVSGCEGLTVAFRELSSAFGVGPRPFLMCLAHLLVPTQAMVREMGKAAFEKGKNIQPETGQANLDDFLKASVHQWFLNCGEMHVTNAHLEGEASALWEEAAHNDGAGSVLHMGVTLWGRRDVRFEQDSGSVRKYEGIGFPPLTSASASPAKPLIQQSPSPPSLFFT